MLKVRKEVFKNLIDRVVESEDVAELAREFSRRRVFFYSLLKDITARQDSPNYLALRQVANGKGIGEELIFEKADRVLSYLAPDEREGGTKRAPALPVEVVAGPWESLTSSAAALVTDLDLSLKADFGQVAQADSLKLVLPSLLAVVILGVVLYLAQSGLLFDMDDKGVELAEGVKEVTPHNSPLVGSGGDEEPQSPGGTVEEEFTSSEPLVVQPRAPESAAEPTASEAQVKEENKSVASLPEDKEQVAVQEGSEKEALPRSEKSPEGTAESEYVVKKGDTLWTISRGFGTSVEGLKEANGLQSNSLTLGDVLIIPDAGRVRVAKSKIDEEKKKVSLPEDELRGVRYTVKEGDTLSGIAYRFDTSLKDLKAANNLDSDDLSVGAVLFIPSAGQTEVKSVETKAVKQKSLSPVEEEGAKVPEKEQTTTPATAVKQSEPQETIQEEVQKQDDQTEEEESVIVREREESLQPEAIPPDADDESVGEIKFKLFNSDRDILGPVE